jgi:HEAT repeat protein
MLAALGRLPTPAAVVLPALTAALRDPAEYPRRQAVESLATFGARARPALPALRRAMKDPAPSVRAEAARALAQVAPRRAVLPILLEALEDQQISGHVANVLGQIGRPARAAVPALVRLLRAADGWTRWRALDALGSMGPAAGLAVLPLAALLQEQDPCWAHYIRPSAAAALGKLGPAARASVPALLLARRDRNQHLRQVIDDALAAIGPPS